MDLKTKILIARAEGVLALAELALERGDPRDALNLALGQARDLTRRGLDPALRRRAWFAALAAFALILDQHPAQATGLVGSAPPRPLPVDPGLIAEFVHGVAPCRRRDLPTGWGDYAAFRGLVNRLLAAEVVEVVDLTGALCAWFDDDPRPSYAHGRALELRLDAAGPALARGARAARVAEAVAAYKGALGAAIRVGAQARWRPTLHARVARLLLRHRADDPESIAEAAALVEALDREAVRRLPTPLRFAVAVAWLGGSASAMSRLRALDALAEINEAAPDYRAASLEVTERYLESLDWGFYSTEQDRARALLDTLAGGSISRTLAYLDLLQDLHGVLGRHSRPDRRHLARLRETSEDDPLACLYYDVALSIHDASGDAADVDPRDGAEDPSRQHLDGAEDQNRQRLDGAEDRSRQRRDVVAQALARHGITAQGPALALDTLPELALESLRQRCHPDRGVARALLVAFARPQHRTPHAQAALALALPTLLSRWREWVELQVELRRALGLFIQHAPMPAAGFAPLGVAMIALDEPELAEHAARRALTALDREAPAHLHDLLRALAQRALDAGHPARAVEWLLPLWGPLPD